MIFTLPTFQQLMGGWRRIENNQMTKREAINGFRRIGHQFLREMLHQQALVVVATNDIAPLDILVYLFEHDSKQPS